MLVDLGVMEGLGSDWVKARTARLAVPCPPAFGGFIAARQWAARRRPRVGRLRMAT